MDKARTTAKDFFLWAGAIVALYWSVVAFIFLMFDYINYALPNPLSYLPSDPYMSGIPYEMASIIVLLPAYLLLALVIRRDIAKDATRADIWVRHWLIIFTLFLAGATMVGDLIVLLTAFLRGDEITLAFILKVLIVLMVGAVVFMHFIADLWGYWEKFPARKNFVLIAVVVLAVATVASGFIIVGTPASARLSRFDTDKITDLQNIQDRVVNYYQAKQKLPSTLSDLDDSIYGAGVAVDSQTNQPYEYSTTTKALVFKLCAVFNKEGGDASQGYLSSPRQYGVKSTDNWQHAAGRVCFDRTIDPELYPPLNPAKPAY